jgi:7,8-dihydropterin-6-yl-methyl-4-(beta-D-ribofuranosyl)aminobenzene 5'-phosphate synthase
MSRTDYLNTQLKHQEESTMKKSISIITILFGILLLVVVVIGIRFGMASSQVARESRAAVSPVQFELGSTKSVTILPLFEKAASDSDLHSEHGVSYLIQTDQQTVLMDVGNNIQNAFPAPLDENMRKLGVSAQSVDSLVISHNHMDHVGGMKAWQSGTFSAPGGRTDLSDLPIYVPIALTYPGSLPLIADQPIKIAEGIASLGRQSFVQPFPMSIVQPLGQEQSLVVNVEDKGLVVITGCGHPGVERIVARAESLFGLPVVGVVGGLHYMGMSAEQVQPHLDFIRSLEPSLVALSPHDSDPSAIELFRSAFTDIYQEIQVGREIHFPIAE